MGGGHNGRRAQWNEFRWKRWGEKDRVRTLCIIRGQACVSANMRAYISLDVVCSNAKRNYVPYTNAGSGFTLGSV